MKDNLSYYIKYLNDIVWSWPLIIFFVFVAIVATITLNFLQVRYFLKSWKLVLAPRERNIDIAADMSPFQAFINALSTSIGNGSLAGMATAVHEGGPGAAFWIFILGFFELPIRFCEVYLSNAFNQGGSSITTGGPMAYLKHVPGGVILPAFYALFCLLLSFTSGNAMQANSVTIGIKNLINLNPYIIASLLTLFVVYILCGGARRIVKFSEAIVPVKVGLFFISALLLLIYHSPNLLNALKIIVVSAFDPQAVKGAIIGTTIQSAIRFGMSRPVNATEIGLGTAAVFFGSTGSKNPVENGILSMVSAFISNYLVCFVLALLIVVTGVWTSDMTSITLTTAAYQTLYGTFANQIIAILSVAFGIGVLVSYTYIGQECWNYLTGNRWKWVFGAIYAAAAFGGSLAKVQIVFDSIDIVNAGLLALNLFAILWLMPKTSEAVRNYMKQEKR